MAHEDEVLRIETALRAHDWAEHTSLDREVEVWTRLAAEVTTYALSIDDYTNDLCSRDYLAELIVHASSGLRDSVRERVAPADEVFRAATVTDADGQLARHIRIGPDNGWWWHRRPATGPLADFLASFPRRAHPCVRPRYPSRMS